MTRTRSLVLFLAALAGFVLAACGGAEDNTSSGATFYAASPLASPSFGAGLTTPSASASATVQVAAGQSSGLGSPTANVSATDQLAFSPTTTTVAVGQVIEWKDTGTVAHNVTFPDSNDATSPTLNPGDTWQVKFMVPGTYQYHCTFHPGMNGTITVTG